MLKPASSTRSALLPLVLAVACGLSILPSAAGATAPIEGVWSFKGGAVDVLGQSDGTLIGIVSVPVKFASCVHPVNEHMWTEMRPQPDGSYYGKHQWFFKNCTPNPVPGPTVWRLLENPQKETFLRVCFAEPQKAQPTISPNGTPENAFLCVDSAAIQKLPSNVKKSGSQALLSLPSAKVCLKASTLKIAPRNPKYDSLKQVVVWVNGKKVANLHTAKQLKRPIRLTRLPNGTFKVRVLAITILNHRVTITRVYHRCKKHRHAKGKHH
jgi:hypothetical protein